MLEPRLRPVLQTGLRREEVQLTMTSDVHWDTEKGHHAPQTTPSGTEWLALDTEMGCWPKGWPQDGMLDPQCCYSGRTHGTMLDGGSLSLLRDQS